jgi:hypothetical protein
MYFCFSWMLNTWHPKLKHSMPPLFAVFSARWVGGFVTSVTRMLTTVPAHTGILESFDLTVAELMMFPVIAWMTFVLFTGLLLLPVVLIVVTGLSWTQVGPPVGLGVGVEVAVAVGVADGVDIDPAWPANAMPRVKLEAKAATIAVDEVVLRCRFRIQEGLRVGISILYWSTLETPQSILLFSSPSK